jgi:rare lipoprotein A
MVRIALFVACVCGIAHIAQAGQAVTPAKAEKGLASWYGAPYHGRASASGEIYNQDQLTAAHRTLPFGTVVRVRRLDKNRSVIVRINDRGPFVASRVIDVSRAAAERLGMMLQGVAPVAVEVLGIRHADPQQAFQVDVRPSALRSQTITVNPRAATDLSIRGI